MIRFIKYILKLFSFVLVIPITNYITDFHSSEKFNKRFVEDLIINDSLTINSNVSEFEIVKKRIELINYKKEKNKTFVLGSSRSMLFGKPISRDVENLTVSGSSLEEIKDVYEILKKNKINIDTLYLEISPWILYPSEPHHKNWNNSTRDFLRNLKKMFSWRYFIENLNPFKYSLVNNINSFIKYSDGTIKYPIEKTHNIDEIKNYAKGEVYGLKGFNNLNKVDNREFNNFIGEIKRDEIYIFFIKHPYPPLINQKILNKYPLIKETDKLINKTASLFNVNIIGSFYPEKLNLIDSDFYDGMHLTPTGLKKLINHKIKNY